MRQGVELIEMDSSPPKVRLVVSRTVYIGSTGETEPSVFVVVTIYKYNRKIEHDRCRKRSTGTNKRRGKKETYLNRENSLCFHCANIVWSDGNDLLFEKVHRAGMPHGVLNSDQRRRNYIRPGNQSCHIDLK